jgi:hypothetical protein
MVAKPMRKHLWTVSVVAALTFTTRVNFASADSGTPVKLFADKANGTVELTPVIKGTKPKKVADGTSAAQVDFVDGGPENSVTVAIDGVKFFVATANLCEVSGAARSDGAAFYQCNQSQGDLLHADLWFVPTVAKRIRLTEGTTENAGFFATATTAATVAVADGTMYVIDATTNAVTKIEGAGAPSWNSAGVLHYRMLNGTAWKFDGGKSKKLGQASHGDLNEGFEPTAWPKPVTFGKNDKPKWK